MPLGITPARTRSGHERFLTPQTDYRRTHGHCRRIGLGRSRAPGAKVWAGAARPRRILRPRRNADLRCAAAAHKTLVSPRVPAEPDFEASAGQRTPALA